MTDSLARVAEMRAHYTRIGEDLSGLTDLDLVIRELDWQADEATKLRDRASQRMVEQRQHDENVRRVAEDRARARADAFARHAIQGRLASLRALIHWARQVGTSPRPELVASLHDAAEQASWALKADSYQGDDLYDNRTTDRERLQQLLSVVGTLEAGRPASVPDVLRLVRAAAEGGPLRDLFDVAGPIHPAA